MSQKLKFSMSLIHENFVRLLKKYTTSTTIIKENLLPFYASINVKTDNPFDLYKEWIEEIPNSISKSYWSLANYSKKDDAVHNRYVQLFHVDEKLKNRFIFMTDKRTEKCNDFTVSPQVSIAILWKYETVNDKMIVLRQIRADGQIVKCSNAVCTKIFDNLSLPAKIRWHLCEQNKRVPSWGILQFAFENLVKEVKSDITQRSKDIIMPKHMIAYEIDVEKMFFFHSLLGKKKFIPDRVVFHKDPTILSKWNVMHITC